MTKKNSAHVQDVMSRDVKMIEPMATVSDAVNRMREFQTSSLIVERRDSRDEFGLITVTDIASAVLSKDHSPDRLNVFEVMSKPVFTLPGDMYVVYGVRLLVRFELSRALVVDQNRDPIGLVTLRDMVMRSFDEAH